MADPNLNPSVLPFQDTAILSMKKREKEGDTPSTLTANGSDVQTTEAMGEIVSAPSGELAVPTTKIDQLDAEVFSNLSIEEKTAIQCSEEWMRKTPKERLSIDGSAYFSTLQDMYNHQPSRCSPDCCDFVGMIENMVRMLDTTIKRAVEENCMLRNQLALNDPVAVASLRQMMDAKYNELYAHMVQGCRMNQAYADKIGELEGRLAVVKFQRDDAIQRLPELFQSSKEQDATITRLMGENRDLTGDSLSWKEKFMQKEEAMKNSQRDLKTQNKLLQKESRMVKEEAAAKLEAKDSVIWDLQDTLNQNEKQNKSKQLIKDLEAKCERLERELDMAQSQVRKLKIMHTVPPTALPKPNAKKNKNSKVMQPTVAIAPVENTASEESQSSSGEEPVTSPVDDDREDVEPEERASTGIFAQFKKALKSTAILLSGVW
ncbi:uncharacterized protein LY89DRAFT_739774 [Mollisia scopiformis]|uniref:Uncharacterized protein n=1 Tax=Mollisia scopiformis TaxID=149040 RepID=A0A194WSX9_MOLSC|nr:uncharacterized protein LY89DRAFT_739774 [Mollisia scopiformis]KUJ10784.1 hypothetical protein LY89DRAFT_739774 [Mollisia scopiformis]